MRAIILAAGLGLRLQQQPGKQFPKCLLRFDGVTLLERHLRMLDAAGVTEVVLALGFEPEQVQAELACLNRSAEIVINPRYDLGSVLTVHTVAEAMTRGGDVLLMDADVLYDERIMSKLVAGETVNRLLIDRDFEAGDEPVKLCLKDGVPVEDRVAVILRPTSPDFPSPLTTMRPLQACIINTALAKLSSSRSRTAARPSISISRTSRPCMIRLANSAFKSDIKIVQMVFYEA